MKVQDVCSAGNTEACERIRFTEMGSFTGGIAGGAALGAALTAQTVGGLCLAFGAPTAGVGALVCGVVVVTTGSLVGSELGSGMGSGMGQWFGGLIYQVSR